MVNALLLVLLLTAVVNDALAATRPARRRCSDPPSPVTRLWLNTTSTTSPLAADAVRTVVDQTWRSAGLTFDWLPPLPAPRLEDTGVSIIVEDTPLRNAPKRALGVVRFVGGQPQKIVRVSAGAIAGWVTARILNQRQWTGGARTFLDGPRASRMVERAMGYVIAHELGHVLLADPHHSREGVMQASYVNVWELEGKAPLMSLGADVRERLRLRLVGLALCD